MPSKSLWILNGPNLNLVGKREPEIYGDQDLFSHLKQLSSDHFEIVPYQSNHEGRLIDWIHEAIEKQVYGLIINPGGLSHTSIALMDAMKCFQGPKVEVHLSATFKREKFRQTKLTAQACDVLISGAGPYSYQLALEYFNQIQDNKKK